MSRSASKEARTERGRTTARMTISLDPATRKKAIANAERHGFKKSVSAYIARLIEEDQSAGPSEHSRS
jgi:hypothetical protein